MSHREAWSSDVAVGGPGLRCQLSLSHPIGRADVEYGSESSHSNAPNQAQACDADAVFPTASPPRSNPDAESRHCPPPSQSPSQSLASSSSGASSSSSARLSHSVTLAAPTNAASYTRHVTVRSTHGSVDNSGIANSNFDSHSRSRSPSLRSSPLLESGGRNSGSAAVSSTCTASPMAISVRSSNSVLMKSSSSAGVYTYSDTDLHPTYWWPHGVMYMIACVSFGLFSCLLCSCLLPYNDPFLAPPAADLFSSSFPSTLFNSLSTNSAFLLANGLAGVIAFVWSGLAWCQMVFHHDWYVSWSTIAMCSAASYVGLVTCGELVVGWCGLFPFWSLCTSNVDRPLTAAVLCRLTPHHVRCHVLQQATTSLRLHVPPTIVYPAHICARLGLAPPTEGSSSSSSSSSSAAVSGSRPVPASATVTVPHQHQSQLPLVSQRSSLESGPSPRSYLSVSAHNVPLRVAIGSPRGVSARSSSAAAPAPNVAAPVPTTVSASVLVSASMPVPVPDLSYEHEVFGLYVRVIKKFFDGLNIASTLVGLVCLGFIFVFPYATDGGHGAVFIAFIVFRVLCFIVKQYACRLYRSQTPSPESELLIVTACFGFENVSLSLLMFLFPKIADATFFILVTLTERITDLILMWYLFSPRCHRWRWYLVRRYPWMHVLLMRQDVDYDSILAPDEEALEDQEQEPEQEPEPAPHTEPELEPETKPEPDSVEDIHGKELRALTSAPDLHHHNRQHHQHRTNVTGSDALNVRATSGTAALARPFVRSRSRSQLVLHSAAPLSRHMMQWPAPAPSSADAAVSLDNSYASTTTPVLPVSDVDSESLVRFLPHGGSDVDDATAGGVESRDENDLDGVDHRSVNVRLSGARPNDARFGLVVSAVSDLRSRRARGRVLASRTLFFTLLSHVTVPLYFCVLAPSARYLLNRKYYSFTYYSDADFVRSLTYSAISLLISVVVLVALWFMVRYLYGVDMIRVSIVLFCEPGFRIQFVAGLVGTVMFILNISVMHTRSWWYAFPDGTG